MTIINISDSIARILSKEVYDEEEDIEVISYGIQAFISTFLNSLLSFLIAYFSNLMYEYILFNLIFIPIRLNHKGYHCKTFIGCLINSNIMIYLAIQFINYANIDITLLTILYTLIICLHYFLSKEKKIYLTIFTYILYYIGLYFDIKISYCFFIAVIFNTILIKGRKLHEKNNQ